MNTISPFKQHFQMFPWT